MNKQNLNRRSLAELDTVIQEIIDRNPKEINDLLEYIEKLKIKQEKNNNE